MSVINFEAYKGQIQTAIQQRITQGLISDPAGFILLDGFINLPPPLTRTCRPCISETCR